MTLKVILNIYNQITNHSLHKKKNTQLLTIYIPSQEIDEGYVLPTLQYLVGTLVLLK